MPAPLMRGQRLFFTSLMPHLTRSSLPITLLAVVPAAVFAWFAFNPAANCMVVVPTEHFVVVALVSLLALVAAVLLARVALRADQTRMLLITLGFMALSGFFAVHALATPGVLVTGSGSSANAGASASNTTAGYGPGAAPNPCGFTLGSLSYQVGEADEYGTTALGVSAFLSVFVPALLFTLAYVPVEAGWAPYLRFPLNALVPAGLAVLLVYGGLALGTGLVAALPLARVPYNLVMAAGSLLLLAFAGWRQSAIFRRTRLPSDGTLLGAFALLGEAQLLMLTPAWTVSWWSYHLLLFSAVVLASGAVIVELDRRRGLERFLPAEAVEWVIRRDPRLGGVRREATVLFADLRGSTSLAETLPAQEVFALLNDYASAFARCVVAEGGMIDKFLGDGIMAVFAGATPAESASAGVRASLRMRAAVGEVNQRRLEAGSRTTDFGASLHHGEVVLGLVGMIDRSDFTVVGDVVNTASRLQEACKLFSADIVISGDVRDLLAAGAFKIDSLGPFPIRGRTETLDVFAVD